jgi:hypothetical protein
MDLPSIRSSMFRQATRRVVNDARQFENNTDTLVVMTVSFFRKSAILTVFRATEVAGVHLRECGPVWGPCMGAGKF